MHVSKKDKDTMLITRSTGDQVYVVTYNYCLRYKLEALAAKYPENYRLIKCTKEGCATFAVNKPCVAVKFNSPEE